MRFCQTKHLFGCDAADEKGVPHHCVVVAQVFFRKEVFEVEAVASPDEPFG